jgi:prepilin-type N-terminal cleavage/methylation domain-containing protein
MKVNVMNQQSSMMAVRRASSANRTHGGSISVARARACRSRRGAFTLVELLVVITIIGIILAFILTAAMDAVRRAEERATQTLITKLDAGVSDRLEALLQTRPDYNNAHYLMAHVYYSTTNPPLPGISRAQVIAWFDYIRAEMPDVFFYSTADANYPLNFAGNAYPTVNNTGNPYPYVLPLGQGDDTLNPAGTGVYGASYTAAAGIYKNLGYLPQGYDGVDNSPAGSAGAGLIDEWGEGVNATNQNLVQTNLNNHKHSTARSEMLYALLVEGRGPLGSVFSRDDFTDKEVQDTDGDGLPEFVDAWGQPLQFYRWPLLYHSDLQRGQVVTTAGGSSWTLVAPYVSIFETREQDPLDPNQQLMAPSWWLATFNANATNISNNPVVAGASNGVANFEYFFHRLSEPDPYAKANFSLYWDRSFNPGFGSRRAFYSKFLIASGGPDEIVGIFRYPDTSPPNSASQLIANENNAMPYSNVDNVADFTLNATLQHTSIPVNTGNPSSNDPTNPNSYDLQQAAQDDITNHNLLATGGIGGSG